MDIYTCPGAIILFSLSRPPTQKTEMVFPGKLIRRQKELKSIYTVTTNIPGHAESSGTADFNQKTKQPQKL